MTSMVSDLVCHFHVVSMMFQCSHEVVLIKYRHPVLLTLIYNFEIVGIRVRVGAGRVEGVVVVGESIKVGKLLNSVLNEWYLFLEG